MEDTILQLGVGGIFCLLILRTVFEFLAKKKGGCNGTPSVPILEHNQDPTAHPILMSKVDVLGEKLDKVLHLLETK